MIQGIAPLQIGNVPIGFPVVQAALSGYSDWAMRLIARRMGASYSLCEVMLDQFLVSLKDRKKTQHFLYNTPEEHPVAGQLMGAEPEQFSLGAQKLVEAGFSVIDINFGCPVRKVLGRCRGGFHLSQPAVALEIVRRTRDIVPSEIPVTIKMRRGIDDTQESRDHFYEILDGAFGYNISAITVHGRTVQQRYIGPSRWSFLKEVKAHVGKDKIILGSGDLFSAEDCLRMMLETGVDGVTVARGCIGNPWIFEQTRAIFEGISYGSKILRNGKLSSIDGTARIVPGYSRAGPSMSRSKSADEYPARATPDFAGKRLEVFQGLAAFLS